MVGQTKPEHREIELVLPTCKFFLKNSCRYGDRCRFSHTPESTTNKSNNTQGGPVNCVAMSSTSSSSSSNIGISRGTGCGGGSAGNLNPQAPVFVPKSFQPRTFAAIVHENFPNDYVPSTRAVTIAECSSTQEKIDSLCPYLLGAGICYYDEECAYIHGEVCELCQQFCLHPTDQEQRRLHNLQCIADHEKAMELSFAVQKSKERTCGICFEIIMEKPGKEQRFGILPGCCHCYCLECIRKWRQASEFDNKIKRSCPECRVTSDFVVPSSLWVDTKEEKDKLITSYKEAMTIKDCKYYNKGKGKCPFGNRCFYRHCGPDGKVVDVGPPPKPVRRHNQLGELEELEEILFWDFIGERNLRILDDVISFLSDSSSGDYSYSREN